MPGVTYTIDFAAAIARLTEGTRRGASSVKQMADEMESATSFARNAVLALAAALGVNSFKEWIQGASEAGDQAGKTSDRFGILTEKLIGMQYAVALAGGQNESFANALRSMNSAALEAAQGSAEMQNVFRLLGIDAETFLRLPVDQQFTLMIDRLHGMENAGLRNAVAQKALGRSYGELMGIIAEGSGALHKAQEDAEAFGTAINRVDAAKLEIANDSIKRAQEASKGLGTTIAIAVAPVVKLLADRFSDAAKESRGFRDEVTQGMEIAANSVAGGIWFVERLQFAYAALKYGAGLAIDGIIQALAGLDRAYTDTMNSLANSWIGKRLGMEAREYSSTLQEMAVVSANRVGELKDELDRLANTALTLDEWKAKVRTAMAQAAADVQREAEKIAAARQSFNGGATIPELKDDTAYQQALAKRVEQIQLSNLTEMQMLDAHLLEQQNTLDLARARDLISEEQYQAQRAAIAARYAYQRMVVERNQHDVVRAMQVQATQSGAELFQVFAGKSKAAALAALAISKGLAIAQVIHQTSIAATAALAPPPIGLGPVYGAPLAAAVKTWGAIEIGLIAATGLAQAASVGSGGAAAGTPANPQVTAPAGGSQAQSAAAAQIGQTTVVEFRARPGDRFDEADVRELLKKIAAATRAGGRVVIAG
jgi:hypothetical protein